MDRPAGTGSGGSEGRGGGVTRTRRYLCDLAMGDQVATRATLLVLVFVAIAAASLAGVLLP